MIKYKLEKCQSSEGDLSVLILREAEVIGQVQYSITENELIITKLELEDKYIARGLFTAIINLLEQEAKKRFLRTFRLEGIKFSAQVADLLSKRTFIYNGTWSKNIC